MGLIKDFRNYRRMKKFEETLALFGLSIEELKNKNITQPTSSKDLEKTTNENIKEFSKKNTPEDDMKLYDVEVEDLHPYGK